VFLVSLPETGAKAPDISLKTVTADIKHFREEIPVLEPKKAG
jgi:hypothetical protein